MTFRGPPNLSTKHLKRLIEEATIDAYNESEQVVGFLTLIEEHLATPLVTRVLEEEVSVTKVDISRSGEIVVTCARGKSEQVIAILDLPLPTPRPAGAEWVEAYRRWCRK